MEISKPEREQLPADGGDRYNRLVFEKSPYLLQHAKNPVDWYPWGEEALAKARREDKPILLSIGYSTCHWCHVMAHESFESVRIAEVLNGNFVAIKVDREERPDLDSLYMKVVQLISGGGGWPLNVLMTPDCKPFFGGTYFPAESAYGRPGFQDILESTIELWQNDRTRLLGSADKLTSVIAEMAGRKEGAAINRAVFDKAYRLFTESYDREYGGFGSPPKFPSPHQLMFLLRYHRRTGEAEPLAMVSRTLRALRQGGICDQLGGGFHRYSTDRGFLVPHFEKMLYDQAMLAIAYLETYQVSGEEFFAGCAREIFAYVNLDLTDAGGAFYSAEDADSEGSEGKFYLWSAAEIFELLGEENGEKFNAAFGVREEGNYHDEASGRLTGLNILHLREAVWPPPMAEARQVLFESRAGRIRPLKDDKILTSWNGLMIAALAMGARILDDPLYLAAAGMAADFILSRLRDDRGRLLRRYRDGEAALAAYLEDYAFLVYGLLNLYEAGFREDYLHAALELNGAMIEMFWDGDREVFSFSGTGNEKLIGPVHDFYDGAIPAGNSVALLNLLKLEAITADRSLRSTADKLSRKIMAEAEEHPPGYAMFLNALDYLLGPKGEIVIAGEEHSAATGEAVKLVNRVFSPNRVVILKRPGRAGEKMAELAAYTGAQKMIDGRTTIYLCRDYACEKPLVELEELAEKIGTFP